MPDEDFENAADDDLLELAGEYEAFQRLAGVDVPEDVLDRIVNAASKQLLESGGAAAAQEDEEDKERRRPPVAAIRRLTQKSSIRSMISYAAAASILGAVSFGWWLDHRRLTTRTTTMLTQPTAAQSSDIDPVLDQRSLRVNLHLSNTPLLSLSPDVDIRGLAAWSADGPHIWGVHKQNSSAASLSATATRFAEYLSEISKFYRSCGEYEEAMRLQQEALDVAEKYLDTGHPMYVGGLADLAIVYADMGDSAQAEPLIRQAFELHNRYRSKSTMAHLRSLESLRAAFVAVGDEEKAKVAEDQLSIIRSDLSMELEVARKLVETLLTKLEHSKTSDGAKDLGKNGEEVVEK